MTVTATRDPETGATTKKKAAAKKKRRGGWFSKLFPLLIMLVGVSVLLYPVVATQYNNYKQRSFAQQYNKQVQQAAPDQLADYLRKAEAYNAGLKGVPILDPYLTQVSNPESGPFHDYMSQLNKFDSMARIRVPAGSIDLPVRHGTTDEVIAKGAGHLYGTSLPVGGQNTHAVLTSHTGMANATLFDHLTSVKKGDLMFVDVYGRTLAYQVDDIRVVLPTQIDGLTMQPGKDLLTLFTCTPYAINTHRLLVTGHRVPYTPAVDSHDTIREAFHLETWMYLLIGAAGVGLLAALVILVRELLRRRKTKKAAVLARKKKAADDAQPGCDTGAPPAPSDAQASAGGATTTESTELPRGRHAADGVAPDESGRPRRSLD